MQAIEKAHLPLGSTYVRPDHGAIALDLVDSEHEVTPQAMRQSYGQRLPLRLVAQRSGPTQSGGHG